MTIVAARTAAERLADHILGLRFEDIPANVIEHAKDLIANHVGLAFSGGAIDDGRNAAEVVEQFGGGASTVLGRSHRARTLDAVFANAGLMSAAKWHDFVMPEGMHPGVVTMPVAWVFGEDRHRSGKDVITALAVGYEVGCALAGAVEGYQGYGRRKGNVFGPLCAASTAARLVGLDRAQVQHALGIAAHSGMGVVEGTDVAWYVYALGSRLGAMAAYLAEAGAEASPTTIEGKNGFYAAFYGGVPEGLDERLTSLGSDLAIGRATIKKYPSSGMNVIAIEQMLGLVRDGLREPDVVEVVGHLPERRRPRDTYMEQFIERPDATALQAMQSLRFHFAVILADGRIDHGRYGQARDPRLQAAFRKVRLEYEPGHEKDTYARVEVTLRDGSRRVAESDEEDAKGIDRRAFLRQDGDRILSDGRLEELAGAIDAFEDVRDVAEVARLTAPDR